MKLSFGDKIIGIGSHNKGVVREISEVRKTGFAWKYPDSDRIFLSEDSNDPFFVWGWKLIE